MNTKYQIRQTMKPYFFLIISLLSIPFLASCNVSGSDDDDPEQIERRSLPRELSTQEQQLVSGTGNFSFDLMHKLMEQDPDKSHFVSPLSIQMAYGMTMNGADGETYSQMQQVLGLNGMSRDEINQAARDLLKLLTEFDDDVRFNIANSIWHRENIDVEEEFLDTNQSYYDATVKPSDFDDPETVQLINGWVEDKTEGLIDEIIKSIDPLTMMYLINAIYFNGTWSVEFDPDLTSEKPFTRPDGTKVTAEMMRLEEQPGLMYAAGEDYRAVNLYYGDAGYAMTLVLPHEETGLENWLNSLNRDQWQQLTDSFRTATLTLEMPRFEMEYEVDGFKRVLQDMGMTDAFVPSVSDFSRINPSQDDLHISDTKHKTFIRVDEEGTEAAAVTSVGIGVTSVPQTETIRFDRPFFYVIREVESNTILFMGTMTDPSS